MDTSSTNVVAIVYQRLQYVQIGISCVQSRIVKIQVVKNIALALITIAITNIATSTCTDVIIAGDTDKDITVIIIQNSMIYASDNIHRLNETLCSNICVSTNKNQ
jgi:hypothetical protein